MPVSELTHSTEQMLEVAWDGIAGSDVSSASTSTYEQLLEGILVALGGSGNDLTDDSAELWAAIANALGGSASVLTMSEAEIIAEAVNAVGGSANHLTDTESEMIAMFANLTENGVGNLVASLFVNSPTFYTHDLSVAGEETPLLDFSDADNSQYLPMAA